MSYRCSVCKNSFVSNSGDICISCKIKSNQNKDQKPIGNYSNVINEPSFQNENHETSWTDYSNKHKENYDINLKKKDSSVYTGTIQSFEKREMQVYPFVRWINSLIYGIPYTNSPIQYEFTIYEDNSLFMNVQNPMGTSVVLYGELAHSFLSNNTKVEVKGKKNSSGIVMAQSIRGVNSNFCVKPRRAISANIIRTVTMLILLSVIYLLFLKPRISSENINPEALLNSDSTGILAKIAGALVLSLLGYFVLKSNSKYKLKLLLGIALVIIFLVFPQFLVYGIILCGVAYLLKKVFRP